MEKRSSGSASHRIRNQLNAVMLRAGLLQPDCTDSFSKLRQLEHIEALVLQLNQLEADLKMQCDPEWLESVTRVLIVEDDGEQRSAMATALRAEGFFVAAVPNGDDAIQYLHGAMAPDVVLMDISMPGCDGHEAMSVIRNGPFECTASVIAITGREQDEELHSLFDGYLQKPVNIRTLVQRIQELVLRRNNKWAEPASAGY